MIKKYNNPFTVSTKRFELVNGYIPKDNQKSEWKIRIDSKIFTYKTSFSVAVEKSKIIATEMNYYFIELIP
jgi:fructose-1,6-bisphosphatase